MSTKPKPVKNNPMKSYIYIYIKLDLFVFSIYKVEMNQLV